MTRDQAKTILTAWRLDLPGGPDPEVTEALALVREDPDLARWFERQLAFHSAVQRGLRTLPVPADLAGKILAERRVTRALFGWRTALPLSAAAVAVGLALLAGSWLRPASVDSLATFRSRMVSAALRAYPMDLQTNDMSAIRAFMARHRAPGDYELTPGLSALTPAGGGLLSWQQKPVAMVCFDGQQAGMFYLFVVDSDLSRGGQGSEFARVSKLATASWTRGNRTYLLAAALPEAELKKFL